MKKSQVLIDPRISWKAKAYYLAGARQRSDMVSDDLQDASDELEKHGYFVSRKTCDHIFVPRITEDSSMYRLSKKMITHNVDRHQISYMIDKIGDKYILEQAKHIDALMKLDKLEERQIEYIIDYVARDPFWGKNILCPKKLREKNKQGVPYWVVIVDKIKQEIKDGKIPGQQQASRVSETFNLYE